MASFHNILLPVDFSEFSCATRQKCSTLFSGGDSREFHFVFVWRPPSDQWHSDPRPELQTELDDFVGGFEYDGEHTTHAQLLMGHPATELCRYARDHACDLIVMATHGRTGLAHLLIGSTTEKVVRHATCPVLTLPRPEVRAEPTG